MTIMKTIITNPNNKEDNLYFKKNQNLTPLNNFILADLWLPNKHLKKINNSHKENVMLIIAIVITKLPNLFLWMIQLQTVKKIRKILKNKITEIYTISLRKKLISMMNSTDNNKNKNFCNSNNNSNSKDYLNNKRDKKNIKDFRN